MAITAYYIQNENSFKLKNYAKYLSCALQMPISQSPVANWGKREVSMKTTRSTDFNSWYNSKAIKNNIDKLRELKKKKIVRIDGDDFQVESVKINLFVPLENRSKVSDWVIKFQALHNDILFEINTIENYIK